MLSGHNFIGYSTRAGDGKTLKVFSTVQNDFLPEDFTVATEEDIEEAVQKATTAFAAYRQTTPVQRVAFLENIAEEILAIGDALIQRAALESGLPEARLAGERGRTVNQLKLFAALLREGSWVEAVIDTAQPGRQPLPRPDLRKMLVPLGPVVVFGASNFPLAFSTAGGDTASALAAGCPVIVKAHNAHLGTNELVAAAIVRAAKKCNLPDGVFSSLVGEGAALGQALAKHPGIKAIGFTGSFRGGMALYKTASRERAEPIPVYAEMSSVNPVLLLPENLRERTAITASLLAASITLGTGQFCTNPGLLFLLDDEIADIFISELKQQLGAVPEGTMLTKGICKNYYSELSKLKSAQGVTTLLDGGDSSAAHKGSAALLAVSGQDFIKNPNLQHEVFGPSSLLIRCSSKTELEQCLQALHGQLTGTVLGTQQDLQAFQTCIQLLAGKVGRLLFNGVPTGVEVGHAMVHGGPFPATTDARSTSVGADAIKRFVRPMCWQDCPQPLLPLALQNSNPLGILRKVNGEWTKEAIAGQE